MIYIEKLPEQMIDIFVISLANLGIKNMEPFYRFYFN